MPWPPSVAAAEGGAEGSDQLGRGGAQLTLMRQRERVQDACAAGRQPQQNFAVIGRAVGASDQAAGDETVTQFDRGVMTDLEALGQRTDSYFRCAPTSLDGQQGLVLLRLAACAPGSAFTEIEEAADFVAKIGERAVIDGLLHILACL